MIGFVLVRLARALATMAIVHAFTFIALRVNVDVGQAALSWNASPEALAAFNARWGLDQPILTQYLRAVTDALRLDLGFSFRDGRTALQWVAERLPQTFLLSGTSFLVMIALGIPTGIYAALRHGRLADRLAMALAVVGFSMPSFVMALALIYIFAVELQWLPSSGSGSLDALVMPATVCATISAAALARFTRSAMLDVLGQPYILAARAGGVGPVELLVAHALPNAAIPIVTYLGFALGGTVGGAIVVETVFAWPGLGLALSEAVGQRDLPIIQTMVLMFAAFMVAANFAVDVLYGLINPKIRLAGHD